MSTQPTLCISFTIAATAQDTMQDYLDEQQVLPNLAASYTLSRCGTLCTVHVTCDGATRGSNWGMFIQCLYQELCAYEYA